MKQCVLVIEDESAVSRGVRDALSFNGYTVEVAEDGATGLKRATNGSFDLIILDLMLPEMQGFDVLTNLRDDGVQTPVLILTARGQETDRGRDQRFRRAVLDGHQQDDDPERMRRDLHEPVAAPPQRIGDQRQPDEQADLHEDASSMRGHVRTAL